MPQSSKDLTTNLELPAEILRHADRLAAQLAEYHRELESRRMEEGRKLVKDVQEAIERLTRDVRAK